MQDGRVIQIGTPEELATAPATPYVAEFTREIPRAKVLSVRAIMTPATANGFAGEVAATTKIEAVGRRVIEAQGPFAVTDEQGRVVGQLDHRAVLDVLAGPAEEARG
jgi:glycine betaine/proline transport system ATP-binding protein